MAAKFVISRRINGDYQFNLKAGNGQVILTSQGYAGRSGCENGIDAVRENSLIDQRFQRLDSTNGKLYFNLLAGNFQIIGVSQMYANDASRNAGIESVKHNAPIASLVDET